MSDQQKLTPELVVMAIEAGMLDDSLLAIEASLDNRKEILSKRAAGNLDTGDRFLVTNCRPKKWNGVEVEFIKHDGIWLVCKVIYPTAGMPSQVRLRSSHVGPITLQSKRGE